MWIKDYEKVLGALKSCNEFLCSECPYARWDDYDYKLRCIHMLINDLTEVVKELI